MPPKSPALGVSGMAQWKQIQLGTVKFQIRAQALLSGLRIWCCCELWCSHRCGSDTTLLWLWCRLAAVALIGPLIWEPPYAMGAALKSNK